MGNSLFRQILPAIEGYVAWQQAATARAHGQLLVRYESRGVKELRSRHRRSRCPCIMDVHRHGGAVHPYNSAALANGTSSDFCACAWQFQSYVIESRICICSLSPMCPADTYCMREVCCCANACFLIQNTYLLILPNIRWGCRWPRENSTSSVRSTSQKE